MSDLEETLEQELEAEAAGQKARYLGLIGIIAGVAGIAIGIAGIVMAQSARTELAEFTAAIEARPDRSADLETQIKDVDERLVRLGGELVKLGRADRELQQNVTGALNGVTRDVAETRRSMQEVIARVGELAERVENVRVAAPARAQPASVASGSTAGGSEPATAAEGGVHIIASGDTLSKVAAQYGVSLSALQAANPAVNPRALQIGQRIVIPQP